MQSGQNNKRRRFNIDEVQAESKLPILSKIDTILRCTLTVQDICEDSENLEEQTILSLLSLKMGFECLEAMFQVLKVIPKEYGPWREEMARDMFQLLNLDSEVTASALKVLMRCQTSVLVKPVDYTDILHRLLLQQDRDFKDIFAGCLTPPIQACICCGEGLQKSNVPSAVTLFTIKGPVPLRKVELRCRSCGINYGINKYGNKEMGYEFYGLMEPVAEASDCAYIDRLVLSYFTSLR